MKRWTDSSLHALPDTKKVSEVINLADSGPFSGLCYRLYQSGSRAFGYIERNGAGHPQFRTLGKHKADSDRAAKGLTLDDAQEKMAERNLSEMKKKKEGAAVKARTGVDSDITFNALLKQFMVKVIGLRNIKQDRKDRWEYTLQTHWLNRKNPEDGGTWGELRVAEFVGERYIEAYEVTLKKVEAERDRAGDKRGPCTLADQTDQFAQRLFKYAVKRQLMGPENVPERLQEVNKARAIKRYQSVKEIQNLLKATSVAAVAANTGMKEYDAVYLRMLLMTGVRVNTLRLAKRSHLHSMMKGFWTFPSQTLKQTKKRRAAPTDHLVPITPMLERELERLDESSGEYDWLFPERWVGSKGEVRPRGDGRAKHLVTEHATLLKNSGENAYTAHALRRTMSNVMLDLGIPNHIVDLASARVPVGTGKTYLTAEIRDQVNMAFERYHAFLEACENGIGEEWMEDVIAQRKQDTRKELADTLARVKRKVAASNRVGA